MEPTPGQPGKDSPSTTPTDPQFRHAIPSYAPPDRAAWRAQHGHAPYRADTLPSRQPDPQCQCLGTGTDVSLPPQPCECTKPVPNKFLTRAQHACGIDYGTLDFKAAIDAHSALETVNTAVTHDLRHAALIGAQDEAWFDPTEDRFYIYPA